MKTSGLLRPAYAGLAMTKKAVRIKSPAKINLFLEVIGKRPDGFHDIKTVFQAVDLCDELTVSRRKSEIAIHWETPPPWPSPYATVDRVGVPSAASARALRPGEGSKIPDQENLVWRAARLFLDQCKIKSGVEIHIRKRIPIAAGLGGGSGNAACTLLALDKLFETRWKMEEFLSAAGQLGSDVPFFIRGVPSVGIDKGSEIIPLRNYLPFWVLLIWPRKSRLPEKTKKVYSGLKMGLTHRPQPITITLAAIETKNVNRLARSLFNRLQDVVFDLMPESQKIWRALSSQGVQGALVSGAGPAAFGIVPTKAAGLQLKQKIQNQFDSEVSTVLVKTLRRTPSPYWVV